MKKHSFIALLVGLMALPFASAKADTVVEGQSTEGKDFWLTFMQADQNDVSDTDESKMITLQLSISAKEAGMVTIAYRMY